MKSVTSQPHVVKMAGERHSLPMFGNGAVECCIETGKLRNIRHGTKNRIDTCQIMRLMQRRERYQFFDFSADRGVNSNRFGKIRSAMHDTVSDGAYFDVVSRQYRVQKKRDKSRVAVAIRW